MKRLSAAFTATGLAALAAAAYADPPIQTPADAFNSGKTFGQSGMNSAAGQVNATTGNKYLPNFTTTAPQSASFGNGQGNVGAAGMNKQVQCQNTVSPDGFTQQECDAINFLMKNPSVRPKFIIDKNNDPVMTGSASTIKNPGTIPASGSQQCHVLTATIPGTYRTESCEQSIVTDTLNCNKNLQVTVNDNLTCQPGTWFTEADAYRNGVDVMQAQAYCDVTQTDGTQVFQVYAHGSMGACTGWQQVTLNMNSRDTVPGAVASLAPHWSGYCWGDFTAYAQVNGCNSSGYCSVNFYFAAGNPFVLTYGSCPGGQTRGDTILFQSCTGSGDSQVCTNNAGSPNTCYLPDNGLPPALDSQYGSSNTTTGYWAYASSLPVTGFTLDPNVQTWSTSMSFQKPKETITISESWDDQCSPFAKAAQYP